MNPSCHPLFLYEKANCPDPAIREKGRWVHLADERSAGGEHCSFHRGNMGWQLGFDETPVKLQEEIKCKNGYMLLVFGGHGADQQYRLYDFREDRCHDNALDILSDYRGILQSDKYAAYEKFAQQQIIAWCPC